MQEWTSDTLWTKAKAFCEQAFEVDPRGPLFPLLASFALETLGKAALSKIHPALIADPRGEGQNILYAFGVPIKEPKTIVAKTVFSRLVLLIDDFTEDDAKSCLLMAERRNRELHTGEFAYDDHKNGLWLPDFYRASEILCRFLGQRLEDLLGASRAVEARETNAREDDRVKAEVSKRLAECAKTVKALKPAELQARRIANEPTRSWIFGGGGLWTTSHPCPACQSKGRMVVKHVGDRPATIVDEMIYVESIYSPRKFDCGVCDLSLSGTPELRLANLADQIIDSSENDPAEFFELDTGPADYEDYGND